MHVSNDRAVVAGLTLSDTAATIKNVQAWLQSCELTPALPPEREAELIRIARDRSISSNRPPK
jgi:hypothetical protein